MEKINYKFQLIEEKITAILELKYPGFYQIIFSRSSELKNELITYIINYAPSFSMASDEKNQRQALEHDLNSNSPEVGLQLETLIHRGIHQIFEEHQHLIIQQLI